MPPFQFPWELVLKRCLIPFSLFADLLNAPEKITILFDAWNKPLDISCFLNCERVRILNKRIYKAATSSIEFEIFKCELPPDLDFWVIWYWMINLPCDFCFKLKLKLAQIQSLLPKGLTKIKINFSKGSSVISSEIERSFLVIERKDDKWVFLSAFGSLQLTIKKWGFCSVLKLIN